MQRTLSNAIKSQKHAYETVYSFLSCIISNESDFMLQLFLVYIALGGWSGAKHVYSDSSISSKW